jgi:hypothetical protein
MAFTEDEKKELSELLGGAFSESLKKHDEFRAEERAKAEAAEAASKKGPADTVQPKKSIAERLLGRML